VMANRHRSAPAGLLQEAQVWTDSLSESLSFHNFKPAGGKRRLRPGSHGSIVLDSSRSSVSSLASSAPSLAGPRVSLSNLSEGLGIKKKNRRKRPLLEEAKAPRHTHWDCIVQEQRHIFLRPSTGGTLASSTPELTSLSTSIAGHHSAALKFPKRAGEVTWDPRTRTPLPGFRKATGLGSSTGSTNFLAKSGGLNREDSPLKESRLFLEPVLTEPLRSPMRNMKRLGPQDSDSWIAATLSHIGSPVARHSRQRRRPSFNLDKAAGGESPSDTKIAKANSRRRVLQRSATSYGVAGGRGVDEVLAREAARPSVCEGFSQKELIRMKRAFKRFKAADCSEVDRNDIYDIIIYLGYFSATEDVVEDIAERVSEFSTFAFEELVQVVENYVSYEREQFRVCFQEHAEALGPNARPSSSGKGSKMLQLRTPSSLTLTQYIKSGEVECSSCGEVLSPECKFCRNCGAERPETRPTMEIPPTPRGKPSGIIPVSRVHEVMRALGLIPLRGVVVEVLAAAGFHEDGNLDFDGFVRFMAVYRVTEGFQREQINKAQHVFRIHSDEPEDNSMGEMEPSHLAQALIEMFGTHASAQVKSIVQKLSLSTAHEQDRDSDANSDSDHSTTFSPTMTSTLTGEGFNNITFHEFLIWARRVHDGMVEHLQDLFITACGEPLSPGMSQTLAADKLPPVLHLMGFTLSPPALEELLSTSGLGDHDEVDFDEFVRFAKVVQKTSGFTKNEVLELSDVFDKYDYNHNGEMDNFELLELLRYLGFKTSLEDVHRFLKKVDHNENGTMDLHEFLRFLRTHKESLVQEITHVFYCFNDKTSGLLSVKDVRVALASAGYEARAETLKDALLECGDPKALTLQNFLDIADRCRRDASEEKRKRAGFDDPEFEKIRRLFSKRCKDGYDMLAYGEFLWLLIDMGMPIKTKEDRDEIYAKLRESRVHAMQAGLSENEVGQEKDTRVTFWALLHFLRHFERENETRAMTKEEAAIDKARFTRDEVKDFRDIYDAWLACNQEYEPQSLPTDLPPGSPDSGPRSSRMSQERRHSLHDIFEPMQLHNSGRHRSGSIGPHAPVAVQRPTTQTSDHRPGSRQRQRRVSVQMLLGTEPIQGMLTVEAFLVLLASIQIQLNVREERILKDKARDISGRDDFRIDFADFLLLMRWITDADLGDINSKVSANSRNMNRIVQQISRESLEGGGSSSDLVVKSRSKRRGSF